MVSTPAPYKSQCNQEQPVPQQDYTPQAELASARWYIPLQVPWGVECQQRKSEWRGVAKLRLPFASCTAALTKASPPWGAKAQHATYAGHRFLKVGAPPSYLHCGSWTWVPGTTRGPVGGPPSRFGRMSCTGAHQCSEWC